MEKEFVPYNLAVKLKALGFDEKVFSYFEKGAVKIYTKSIYGWDFNAPFVTRVSRPTFSQAFRWFREKYELYSFVFVFDEGFGYETYKEGITQTNESFNSYEEAKLACLTKLIEIVENK